MKTRTLLLLAVSCGLIILVAGSIKVFLIADDKAPAHLLAGSSAKVGDMTVTFESVSIVDSHVVMTVVVGGVADADGATSFIYGTGSKQLPPVAPPAGADRCAATVAAPTTCVLAFDTVDVPGVLSYHRAGETVRWDVVS